MAQNYERKIGSETDLGHLLTRQNLPSDFSYGDVAYELRTTATNFHANSGGMTRIIDNNLEMCNFCVHLSES